MVKYLVIVIVFVSVFLFIAKGVDFLFEKLAVLSGWVRRRLGERS